MTIPSFYQEEIIDHAKNPRNFRQLSKPDIKNKENNFLCGDEIEIQLKLNAKGKVKEAAFQGEGCAISQAAASLLTENIKGKTLVELKKFSAQDMLNILGVAFTPARLKCALLALESLKGGLKKLR